MSKITHFMYTPFTGLGKYNGFRGNNWLKNRIQIFKQFVIPSLQAQTNKNFVLWVSWRPEEKNNKYVKELYTWLENNYKNRFIFTYHGICFYDDKYEDSIARERLLNSIHYTMGELHDIVADSDYVLMTIQPSDDLYKKDAVWQIQKKFNGDDSLQAVGYSKGYIMNYWTKEVAEYNPTTNPPFYTIKFPRKEFLGQNPNDHLNYTALKHDVGKYKKGTPLPSHEYVGDCLKYKQIDERGFMVGTHLENISTTWQIPFKGESVTHSVIREVFGEYPFTQLSIKVSPRKKFYFSLPYKVQRKIRYWLTEKFVIKWKNPLKRFWFWRNYTTNQHTKWWENRKIDWKKEYLDTWYHPHRQIIAQVLAKMQWRSLFEVGCGPGANLVHLLKNPTTKDRQMQLGGCDVNKDAIELAKKMFIGPQGQPSGTFFVCPAKDILMSDKSTDLVLTDMALIYVGENEINKTLKEIKRVARNYVVLCEFDSESWWERFKLRLYGYHAYNYKKKLLDNGYYDIVKYRIGQGWPNDKLHQKFASIIVATVPKYNV